MRSRLRTAQAPVVEVSNGKFVLAPGMREDSVWRYKTPLKELELHSMNVDEPHVRSYVVYMTKAQPDERLGSNLIDLS